MNKTQLVDTIAAKSDLSKKAAAAALDAFTSTVSEALSAGDEVALVGFGSFKIQDRPARAGRNPRTGEVIQIAATKNPRFVAGKNLKEEVNR